MRNGISAETSAGLDFARALAAIYVVLHHVANAHGFSNGWGIFLRFGQEAVIVFFVLSGFVVFASEHARVQRPRGYYLRRLRRIYPPLLFAMLVATLIAWADGNLAETFDGTELIATVIGLQDLSYLKPGVIADPYMNIDPLWSLSYEIFFYAIFPLVYRLWVRNKVRGDHVIGLTCCLAYFVYALAPGHFSLVIAYFLVWWAGAAAAHAYLQGADDIRGLARTFGWLVCLCAVAAAVAAGVIAVKGFTSLGVYPVLPLRHFAVAALLLAMFFNGAGRRLSLLVLPWRRSIAFLASISYGLYVLHQPLLIQWSLAWSLPGFAAAMCVLLAASYGVERIVPRFLPKAPKD